MVKSKKSTKSLHPNKEKVVYKKEAEGQLSEKEREIRKGSRAKDSNKRDKSKVVRERRLYNIQVQNN